jgi:hypothetical protein
LKKVNRIEFNLIGKEGYPGKSIEILIDGVDIIRKLGDFERKFTEDESKLGDYLMRSASDFSLSDYLYRQFKAENTYQSSMEKTILFGCSCGCAGCWDMLANISRQDDKVIWSGFEQPNRGPNCFEFWDYSAFGPFEFDSGQYLEKLEQARQQAIKLFPTRRSL